MTSPDFVPATFILKVPPLPVPTPSSQWAGQMMSGAFWTDRAERAKLDAVTSPTLGGITMGTFIQHR